MPTSKTTKPAPKVVRARVNASTKIKRDNNGQFATKGSGGLKTLKKFNWGRALPVIIVVALVGGFFVWRSLAYSAYACSTNTNGYVYDDKCVMGSDEASVIRTYYAFFNREPDTSGFTYYKNQLLSKKMTVSKMVSIFVNSSEFKRKYGGMTNSQFVKAIYPQVFGRPADATGATFWTNQLNSGKYTRTSLMTYFIQSSEMKQLYSTRVAAYLKIPSSSYSQKLHTFAQTELTCHGAITTDSLGKKWCQISGADMNALQTQDVTDVAILSAAINQTYLKGDGEYMVCTRVDENNTLKPTPGTEVYFWPFGMVLSNEMSANPISQLGASTGSSFSAEKSVRCDSTVSKQQLFKTYVMYASSKGQPNDATYKVAMDNIYISKLPSSKVSAPVWQKNPVKVSYPSNYINVGRQIKSTTVEYYDAVATADPADQPLWVHNTGYFKGTVVVGPFYCSGVNEDEVRLKFGVLNPETNTSVTNFKLFKFVYPDQTTYNPVKSYYPSTNGEVTLNQAESRDVYVELTNSSLARRKVTANVLSGKCTMMSNVGTYEY
jgi:hypothetical protein